MDALLPVDRESLHLALIILVKMGMAAFLGALVGWERERGGRPAGIRTHMLIAIGVVLFTEVGRSFTGSDPSRVASQIVTGIGFLGAGTILRTGLEIKGLTTAASIWAVAAISMAVALGGYLTIVAIAATLVTLFTLAVVTRIEARLFPGSKPHELILSLKGSADVVAVLKVLNQAGMAISRSEILSTEPKIELLLRVAGDRDTIMRSACILPGVENATWSD